MKQKPDGWRGVFISIAGLMIPMIIVIFTAGALAKGIPIYEEFVQGAKEGWEVAMRIMPFLVGMLVALAILRDSGTLLLLKAMLGNGLTAIGFHPDLLPMALMRPLSGSGSTGVLAEILSNKHDAALREIYRGNDVRQHGNDFLRPRSLLWLSRNSSDASRTRGWSLCRCRGSDCSGGDLPTDVWLGASKTSGEARREDLGLQQGAIHGDERPHGVESECS